MITRVAHVGLRVTDLEAAVRFTTDILGLRESSRVEGTSYLTCNENPLKFSHVFIKAEDTGAMEDFLTRIFGFRVSSRSGDIAWLRCNPEHHAVALAPGRNQLHHAAWEVDGWGTIEQLGDHLRRNGLGLWFGPGRHGPGNSIFAYFFDPDGFIFEYAAEFQRIGNEAAWETEIWPDEPLTVNPWGPAPPDDFLEHGVDVVQRATTLTAARASGPEEAFGALE